jgi:hypothetical protein
MGVAEAFIAIIGILGALVGVACGVWCMVIAFKTNIWWGLAFLFIPFAGLAFVITHWDKAGKPFLCGSGGFLIMTFISMALPGAKAGLPQLGGGGGFGGFGGGASADEIRKNMHGVQLAAEAYGTDHGGDFSPNVELLKAYFPGGHPPTMEGKAPINPVTKEPEWPIEGTVTDVAAARAAAPGKLKAGAVEYSVIYDPGHHPTSYAVRGGDGDGNAVANPRDKGSTLVLSNQ